MDDATRNELQNDAQATAGDGADRPGIVAVPLQLAFTADDIVDADTPIAFELTARARRVVAPSRLPDLAVVDTRSGSLVPVEDDPTDTRPARARALRRAGGSTSSIAAELECDELLVMAWCAEVAPAPRRRPSTHRVVQHASNPNGRANGLEGDEQFDADAATWSARRDRTRDEVELRLAHLDPLVAAAAGVVVGIAEISTYAITLTTASRAVARQAVRFLIDVVEADPDRLRLVLRHGRDQAGDRLAHEWAEGLGIEHAQVRTVRAHASDPDEVEALLRVPSTRVSADLAAWRDVLLGHERLTDPGAGTAF